jgi:hypothetical protein
MLAKKLILASIGVMFINTGVYGEEWGRVKCLRECTNASCMDATKQNECQTNCAQSLDSIDACMKAKPQGSSQGIKSTNSPRRALPPAPSTEEQEPAGITSSQSSKRHAMRLSKSPLVKSQSSTKGETIPPQRPQNPPPQLVKQPSGHHVTGAGGKGVTAEQMNALNKGKGVKVKHMKEKIEGLEKLIGVLEKRIGLLEPLAEHAFGTHELLARLQKNTGFDKPEIRNNPEHDIEYKPEQFSAASSATGTLDGTSCQAVLARVQEKVKGTKDKVKTKTLSTFEAQLTEMCKLTKDLNREPAKKVHDAEAVNRIFGEAKKLF